MLQSLGKDLQIGRTLARFGGLREQKRILVTKGVTRLFADIEQRLEIAARPMQSGFPIYDRLIEGDAVDLHTMFRSVLVLEDTKVVLRHGDQGNHDGLDPSVIKIGRGMKQLVLTNNVKDNNVLNASF